MGTQAARLHDLARLREKKKDRQGACPGHLVTVVGGKGGVGKTNLTLNTGIALSQKGHRTLIIDGDLSAANMEALAPAAFSGSLLQVGRGAASLAASVSTGPSGVDMIRAVSSGDVVNREIWSLMVSDILHGLEKALYNYDWALIDTGPAISEETATFAHLADRVLVVTTGEPPSLTGAYTLIKFLIPGRPALPLSVVVNGAGSEEEAGETLSKLRIAVEHFLQFTLEEGGWICWDANIPRAVCSQTPFLTAYPETTASALVRNIAGRLEKERVEKRSHALASGM